MAHRGNRCVPGIDCLSADSFIGILPPPHGDRHVCAAIRNLLKPKPKFKHCHASIKYVKVTPIMCGLLFFQLLASLVLRQETGCLQSDDRVIV